MTQSNSELATTQTPLPDKSKRRTRLHEFQVALVERLQAARSNLDARANLLGVMIGETHCLFNLQETGEIVAVSHITTVPLAKDWFLGVTNIRGNLVSVVDFARFQGLPPTPMDNASRIVCLAPSLMPNGGLLVSRVMGLRNVAQMTIQEETEADRPQWAGRRYIDPEGQVWTELHLSLITQDPNFLHVGL